MRTLALLALVVCLGCEQQTPGPTAYEVEHAKWEKARGGPLTVEQELEAQRRTVAIAEREQRELDNLWVGMGFWGWEGVQPGMTLAEVERILGKGRETASSADRQIVQWQFDEGPIFAIFADGKLVSKGR